MEQQLNQIADQTGVPADLLERAARARADKQGVAVEALVASWAGGEAPVSAPAEPEPDVETPAAPATASGEGGKQLPEALLRRSAEAKAKREGRPVEEVLAEMGIGVEAATPAAPPAEDSGAGKLPDALLRRSAAAKAKREGRPLDEVLVEMGLSPEGAASEAPAVAEAAGASAPATAPAAAAAAPETAVVDEPEAPVDEPEPLFSGFPRWLAASFIIVPIFALLYAGFAPNGPDCGTSGQLAINPVTGEAEACDGGASPFFTQGETLYTNICAACHSADGSGGVGPAFIGGAVLQTFSACTDHIEWVTIGSNDWPEATYGDTAKPAGGTGVMPGYASTLSEQEIASVVLYERVAFGGQNVVEAEQSCGLVEAAGG